MSCYLPDALVAAAERGELVPFIGAGMPKALGYPLWSELIERMGVQCEYDPPDLITDLGDTYQVAQRLLYGESERSRRASTLCDFLHSKAGLPKAADPAAPGWDAYEQLVNWGPDVVFTTNYDDTLEQAWARYAPERVVASIAAPQARRSRVDTEIIHFHGRLDRPESIVLAEDHYMDRLRGTSALDRRLREEMGRKSFVFLGYGYSDINVRYLTHLAHRARHGKDDAAEPRAWLVTHSPNELFERIMEPKGLHHVVVPVAGPGEVILHFLRDLNRRLAGDALAAPAHTADRIFYVSSNQAKFREVEHLLPDSVAFLKDDFPEIVRAEPVDLLKAKAREIFRKYKRPFLVDHMDLTFASMQHALPSCHYDVLVGKLGLDGLCRLAAADEARARCVMLYCDGKRFHVAEASTTGTIRAPVAGAAAGLGWDGIFVPNGENYTYASMSLEDKQRTSPRAEALRALKTRFGRLR